jgi:hypothetical protein
MKRLVLFSSMSLLLACCIFSISSCNKLEDLAQINFNLSNAEAQFTIPVISAIGTADLGTATIYINLDSIIKAQNSSLSVSNVKQVHITSCELTLLNGDASNNFSALESCSLQMASNNQPTFVTVGSITANPDTEAETLTMPLNSTLELKDYFLNANTFSYKLSGTARKTTAKELTCKAVLKYSLVVGL